MSQKNKIGVIGLSTMGANLAQNLANNNLRTAVYNRSFEKTKSLLALENSNISGFKNLKDFVNSLETPRKIVLMVKSGEPVDQTIKDLEGLVDKGDVIIDCGNSHWKDTENRIEKLSAKGVHFIGCGVSGGAEGALNGPSIMPGGDSDQVNKILPILEKISAKDFKGGVCVTNVGLGGAGHFVKTVHNGIEYAIMQGIAEVYDVAKYYGFEQEQIVEMFQSIDQGLLKSFLLETTISVLQAKEGDEYLVDIIKDTAKAKGTGSWTVEAGLEFGSPVPSIAAAVFARTLSSRNESFKIKKDDVLEFSEYTVPELEQFVEVASLVLEKVFLAAYIQGLDLISKASIEKKWNVNTSEVIRIWQGGCIIRSGMLENLAGELEGELDVLQGLENLKFIAEDVFVPTPVIHSTFNYLLSLSSLSLPTNLIQAQRDYFGQHTYQRVDKEGDFSGGWLNN